MLPSDIRTQFLSYLRFELNLSANTCEAYLSDVDKLLSYLDSEGIQMEEVDYPRLQHFIATLHDLGISPTSVSRIISGIRSFGRYLLLEGYIETDPTALLEVPRKGRYLPTVLTTGETDRIIEAGSKASAIGRSSRSSSAVVYG